MARLSQKHPTAAFDRQVYLNHLIGLASLLAWRARWEALGADVPMEGPILALGLLPSQRFALGFPTKPKYGHEPFLAVQPEEAVFCKRLRWANGWVDVPNHRLVLTTQKVLGDGETLEDLPAMGVAIGFDREEKVGLLDRSGRLSLRALWFDEEGLHVSGGLPLASVPLHRLGDAALFPDGAISQSRTLRDLVNDKLLGSNHAYLPFEGAAVPVASEWRDLVDPFRAENVPKVRPD